MADRGPNHDSDATDSAGLQAENERLLEFLYLVPVGLAQIDVRGDIALMNSTGAQYLIPLAEAPALANLFDVLDRFAPELRNIVRLHPSAQGTICEGRRIDLVAEGHTRGPTHLAIGLVKVDSERVMAVVQDVTRTVAQERALFADEQRFRAIYDGMRDAMICTLDRDERIDSWNASGERLFGLELSGVAGATLRTLVALGSDADNSHRETESLAIATARRSGWSELQGWGLRKDGSRFWGEGVLSALYDEAGEVSGFSVVLRDLTERKLASEKLLELATTDALTDLANRRTFYLEAEKEILRRGRHQTPLSVLMIDADRFKTLNDTHGHAAGDEVLRSLAATLKRMVRAVDLPARYGGEEFVVLLPASNGVGALALAGRIRTAMEDCRVELEGKTLHFTVSIGVAEATSPSATLKDLLSSADRALYRAKEEGRNRVVLGEPV